MPKSVLFPVTMASAKPKPLTPMMRQYLAVREGLPPKTLLLFRLGDFYEMFDEDASLGADLLGITLTKRNGMPMAGIPYHAADTYIQKVLGRGYRVAICDQIETPKPGKIVKRALTRILTPGTTLEDHQLDSRSNHYLLAMEGDGEALCAAWLDLSTGEFQIAREPRPGDLMPVLTALSPREILIPESAWDSWLANHAGESWLESLERLCEKSARSDQPDHQFALDTGRRMVLETLGVLNLDGFGIARDHPALGAAGALITYATESLCAKPENLSTLREYRSGGTLLLDPATLTNLEIFRSTTEPGRSGSLLEAMDHTVTAPGARLLERYLSAPPLDLAEIRRRHACVAGFLGAPAMAAELQDYLKHVRDLPRILGRLRNRIKTPRELGGVRDTLQQLPLVREVLTQFDEGPIPDLGQRVRDFPALRELLEKSLEEELSGQLTEGGYIRDNYDAELDRLRGLMSNNKTWLTELERKEQERTGIRKLRIRYTGAFGYYIEVTKSNLHLVPDDYVRKQTTVNAERYFTPELKEKEREILHAEEKSVAREEELFRGLVEAVLDEAQPLEEVAAALAEIDLFIGWARLAREWDYCCPEVNDGDAIEIEEGRHPVVEQGLRRERDGLAGTHAFVPNDTNLSASAEQIAIITGPNMAGKSTYIRQVALLVLMAQVGSWVPAKSCRLGMVDRIFSRVGASDELSRGNSTFMVEMNETANILNNATERSLIILDEIGRGTSTYDGLSIAWSVVEHLHGNGQRGPRTLFATHYHELTQIEEKCPRVRNYSVAVKEWNDRIIFVRQVTPGATDRSYGIQVARLAGLPPSVIDRAKEILARLESNDSSHNLLKQRMRAKNNPAAKRNPDSPGQMEMF